MTAALTIEALLLEAKRFATRQSKTPVPPLFGITDGKAVGTYVEHEFRSHLRGLYQFSEASSAKGIDFPDLEIDVKVTSIRQPQSSCPFQSARQKIYGLGYSLLLFVYEKSDDPAASTSRLDIVHTIFIEKTKTADFQTTTGIRRIVENEGNRDDLLGFIHERMLPVDEVEAVRLADELLRQPPVIGYLTISNALQWRLQYARVIDKAGDVEGIHRLA